MKIGRVAVLLVGATVLAGAPVVTASSPACSVDEPFCFNRSAQKTAEALQNVTIPDIAVPVWLNSGEAASADIQ